MTGPRLSGGDAGANPDDCVPLPSPSERKGDAIPSGFTATVFGLRVASQLALWPALERADAGDEPDLVVRLAAPDRDSGNRSSDARGGPALRHACIDLSRCPTVFWCEGVGRYVVHDGRRIDVFPDRWADRGLVAHVVRSIALAVALHQRGRVLLHGSSFASNGQGICLVGPSGAGKSTALASALARGGSMISDGMTVLERIEDGFRAWPGPPELKLLPDTMEHMGARPEAFPKVLPVGTKRLYPAGGRAVRDPVPLTRILLLSDGHEEQAEELSPSERLFGLLNNAYLAEYVSLSSQPALLQRVAPVANAIPVQRLTRRRGLEHVSSLLNAIQRWTGAA